MKHVAYVGYPKVCRPTIEQQIINVYNIPTIQIMTN